MPTDGLHWIGWRGSRTVNTVAINAIRCIKDTIPEQRFAVDALRIFPVNFRVTLTAGFWNVHFVNLRLRAAWREDIMNSVTIGALRFFLPIRTHLNVNTFNVIPVLIPAGGAARIPLVMAIHTFDEGNNVIVRHLGDVPMAINTSDLLVNRTPERCHIDIGWRLSVEHDLMFHLPVTR